MLRQVQQRHMIPLHSRRGREDREYFSVPPKVLLDDDFGVSIRWKRLREENILRKYLLMTTKEKLKCCCPQIEMKRTWAPCSTVQGALATVQI